MRKKLKKYDFISVLYILAALFGPIVLTGVISFITLLLRINSENFILILTIFFLIIVLEMALILLQSNERIRIKDKKMKGGWIPIVGMVISFLMIVYHILSAYTYIKGWY